MPRLILDEPEKKHKLILDEPYFMPPRFDAPIVADPQGLSSPVSPVELSEQKKRVGFVETLKEEFTDPAKAMGKVPIIGAVAGIVESIDVMNAAKRISGDFDYSKPITVEQQRRGLITVTPRDRKPIFHSKETDVKRVEDFIEDITKDRTFFGKVAAGASALPTWMLEFAMTGGIANFGKEATKKGFLKLLKNQAKTKAGQIALRTAGWTGGAITRASLGLTPRIAEKGIGRQLQIKVGLQEQEGWATSFAIAWGDVVIESASEEAGEAITGFGGVLLRKTKLGAKFADGLQKAWTSITGGTTGKFNKLLKTGGYSNILGEIGEERLGTILRAITDVEDFGAGKDAGTLERLAAGLEQDIVNLPVEAVVLSLPMAGQSIANINIISKPPTQEAIQPTEPRLVEEKPAPEKKVTEKAEITQPAKAVKPEKPSKPLPEQPVTAKKEKYTPSKAKIAPKEYIYHGTSEGAFRRIREQGITGKEKYFSTDELYAQSYADRKGLTEGRMLRIAKTPDILPDKRIPEKGDFKTARDISPQEIEVKVGNKWVPIQEYVDEAKNIMPIAPTGEGEVKQPQPLIEEAKKYKSAVDYQELNKLSKHPLDHIPKNTPTINVSSTAFEKEKTAFGKVGESKIAYHERREDGIVYWDNQIKEGARPPVLVGVKNEQIRVVDGNNRLNAYLKNNVSDIPIILTKDAQDFLAQPPAKTIKQEKGPKKTFEEDIAKPVKQRHGLLDVKLVQEVHRTFMRVLEPAKAVERNLGKDAYAAVIKGIHATDVARVEFEQKILPQRDKTVNDLESWLGKFSDKDLDNLMLSRGNPVSVNAQLIKRDAINKLPKKLRGQGIQKAIQEIADFNYKYLQSVVGDDINRVSDYFYGIYKDPKKVDKFLDYWRTTKRFTKEKKLPTYADAKDYGLTIRNPNPITNLKSEYVAIAHLEGMTWLRDELMRTGQSKFIEDDLTAPLEWDKVSDPVFSGLRLQPDLAKMINNLIATNKITKVPIANTLRQVNNFLRTIKFIGSGFHLLSVAKQSVADSGYLGFLYKKTATRGFTTGFRKNDKIYRTKEYKDYINHGGGHRYSVESESRRAFSQAVNELNKNMGIAIKAGSLPLRIPVKFVDWMFNSYIPKVKYAKYLDNIIEQEKKLGRSLKSSEKIDIIKEQQNFYGMMNERLFGRSGTVTTGLRFYFMSPGYAEGNYRTMIKSATQWGGKEGFKANRSRSNIVNSLILTGILGTVGTMIMTGKPPKVPETPEDLRDLFKIDTGKKDDKGRRIMVDMMTYDKDYWQVAFNVLKGRPDVAVKNAIKRIGGMKAPTADMIVDMALVSMGRAVYDWKGDRITEITDPFLTRAMKITVHEIKKLEPISVSVYKQSRKKDIDKRIAAIESLLGFRPTMSEKDKRENEILKRIYSIRGQKEELDLYLGGIKEPRKAVERYNKTVKDILDSPITPPPMKAVWEPKLIIDIEKRLENKAFTLGGVTQKPEDIERAVKYLKNFGLTSADIEEYIRRKRARETKRTKISPLDRDPVIGLMRRINRAKERM